ncbi:MAG: hypothetical protein JWO90_2739, partial [Solirubrobacterales bacterium]|nr:hypothetical protein [Solirubrobacterales bacterium]
LVTTAAPGPYAALPLARALAPDLVLPADADAPALAAALRTALARSDPEHAKGAQPTRIAALLEPFTRANADRVVASELLPRLLRG